MFLKKKYIDKSTLNGIGLFAGEVMKKGDILYQHSPNLQLRLSPEEFGALSDDERATFSHYGYEWKGVWYLDFDDIRFLNHADEPNLLLTNEGIVAARNIAEGEELTQNYRDFEDEIRF